MKASRKIKHRKSVRRKKDAWRIAIFLNAVGIRSDIQGESWRACLDGLLRQYSALPDAVKAEAPRHGRSQIRDADLKELGSAMVAPSKQKRRKRVPAPGASARPKCSACRSQWGPKALWPTQEEAEQFLVRNGDSGRMRSYRCPISGFHVGRLPSPMRTAPTIPISTSAHAAHNP